MLEKVQAFLTGCAAQANTVVDSKRDMVLSMSDIDINAACKHTLDEARAGHQILSQEVYLNYSLGRPLALFGSDIWAWKVIFPGPAYFRMIHDGNRRAGVSITEEDQYITTYEICESLLERYLRDLRQIQKASGCSRDDIFAAIAGADESHKHSLNVLTHMRKSYSSESTEEAIADLTRLSRIISVLSKIAKRP